MGRGPTMRVAAVPDGETLVLEDGTKVRLIGAMTPRKPYVALSTRARNADRSIQLTSGLQRAQRSPPRAETQGWPLAETAQRALATLAYGRPVTLWRSKPSRKRLALSDLPRDRYSRVLAHVTVAQSVPGSQEEIDPVWIQAAMLRDGWARAYSATDARACARQMQRHEAAARDARRNIWRDDAYRVHQANRPNDLVAYTHTFQIIQGRVLKVAKYRNVTYLNFGRHWKTDFTLLVRGRAHKALSKGGLRVSDLEGRAVRVRGWLQDRDGPMMQLTHAEQIELLDPTRPGGDAYASGALAAFDLLREGPSLSETGVQKRPGEDVSDTGADATTSGPRRTRKRSPALQNTAAKSRKKPRATRARPAPAAEFLSM